MTDYSKTVQDLINLWSENKERTMVMTNWENKLVGEKAEPRYVILDFETTGANVTNHNDKELGYFKGQTWYDAIQIALIDTSVADENTQSGYKEYSWRIKPHKDYADRADWATAIHGHTKDDYMKRTDLHEWTDIFPELARIMNDKTIVAHNAFGFDKSVFEQMCDKYGLIPPVCDWRDTKAEVKQMFPDKPASQKDCAAWMGFDEDFDGHDALVDTQMLTKIFFYIESYKKDSDDYFFV